jgi:hypothetical protein
MSPVSEAHFHLLEVHPVRNIAMTTNKSLCIWILREVASAFKSPTATQRLRPVLNGCYVFTQFLSFFWHASGTCSSIKVFTS